MRTLRLGMLGAGFLAAAVCLSVPSQAQEKIVIAVAGPITGQYAAFGEQMRRGAEMAVADINAKGGVLGKHLQLEVGDDACDPKQAVAVANQLASKGVVFVAGHYCSGSSIPASEVYADEGMLQISPASTNPVLTDRGDKFKNVFRVCGRDDQQGVVAGDWLAAHFKGKNVAVVDDKSQYGKGLADFARQELLKQGMKVVLTESVNQGDKDFTALISKMKQAGVQVIYYGGYHTEAGLLVRQAHDQGLNATLASGDALVTNEFWSIAGPAGQGTLMTFDADPRKNPVAAAIVAKFKQQGYDPEGYTLYTYAAVQIFAQAATQAKSAKLSALLPVLHQAQFETVLGPIAFNAKGDVTTPAYKVYAWKDGKYDYAN